MGVDETRWRLLKSEERGKSKTWWIWVRRVNNAVHYHFDESRGKGVALALLGTYKGTAVVDGFASYPPVAQANPDIKFAHCWGHARRERLPYEHLKTPARALRVIQRMYRLEALAKERGLAADELLRPRQRRTKPLLKALLKWAKTLSHPMPTLDQVFAEAMQLSDEDRAKLADRLLEVVPDEPDAEVEEAWMAEVRRRRAEWKAGRVQALPAEEALAQMFAKP